jgi:hypothetical protein
MTKEREMKETQVMVGRVLRSTAKDGYVFKLKTVTHEDARVVRDFVIKCLETELKGITNIIIDGKVR